MTTAAGQSYADCNVLKHDSTILVNNNVLFKHVQASMNLMS